MFISNINHFFFIIQGFQMFVFIFIVIFPIFQPMCPSLDISCQTWEFTWNFKPRPSFNPQWLLALILLTITGYKCYVFLYCYSPAVRIKPAIVMVDGIRASDPCELNEGCDFEFHVGFWVWQETPEEGRMTRWPKHCEYNNKDEDNSRKTLNDKNHQALSQKFRQLILIIWWQY